MKMKKIISVIAMFTLISGTVFSVNAVNKPNDEHETAALSYADANLKEYAQQVAVLVNKERKSNGLNPLRFSPLLSEAALIRSGELPKSFSHTRPDGSSFFTAMTELGISYRTAGENIAYGQKNPESVMNAWMNSSGHRSNILNKNVDYIGVGVTFQNGMYYWTQLFAASDQLYEGSYPSGRNAVTTAPVTTAVHTSTTVKTTTTAVKTTSPAETSVTTTAKADDEKPDEIFTTIKTTDVPETITSTTITTVIPVTDIVTTTTITTTTNCTVIKPPVITIPVGDNCSGIGIGVIVIKGKN